MTDGNSPACHHWLTRHIEYYLCRDIASNTNVSLIGNPQKSLKCKRAKKYNFAPNPIL
ncbi:hypothetical protein CCP2SC5_370011 [Azospirillaceae bacterium]